MVALTTGKGKACDVDMRPMFAQQFLTNSRTGPLRTREDFITTFAHFVIDDLSDNALSTLMPFLVARGLHLNLRRNSDGCPLLHLAIRRNKLSAVRSLVAAGANLRAVWSNRTPMQLALDCEMDEVVPMLMAGGARCAMIDAVSGALRKRAMHA